MASNTDLRNGLNRVLSELTGLILTSKNTQSYPQPTGGSLLLVLLSKNTQVVSDFTFFQERSKTDYMLIPLYLICKIKRID
jgi:hypothetical protein